MFNLKKSHFYLILKSKGNIKKFRVNIKIYDSLKDSKLFDEDYYLKKYPNIKKFKINPLLHYIIIGSKEHKIPSQKFKTISDPLKESKLFDEDYYLKKYPNIKKSEINPLLHYIIIGSKEHKIPSQKFKTIKILKRIKII